MVHTVALEASIIGTAITFGHSYRAAVQGVLVTRSMLEWKLLLEVNKR